MDEALPSLFAHFCHRLSEIALSLDDAVDNSR